jgi:hypothetical protein
MSALDSIGRRIDKPNEKVTSDEQSRKSLWATKCFDLSETRDALGLGIEDGIRRIVAGLQLFWFITTGSCEGHNDWGLPYPWVQIEAGGKPRYRWQNEEDMWLKIMLDLHIKPEEIDTRSPAYNPAKREQMYDSLYEHLAENADETEEYTEWSQRNEEIARQINELIMDYYATNASSEEPRIDIERLPAGEPRLIVSDDMRLADEKTIKRILKGEAQPDQQLTERVRRRQNEMKRFGEFLRNRFLSV